MRYKKSIGIGMVLIGLIILLVGKAITGAVIGLRPSHISWLGILIMIGGIVIVFSSYEARKDFYDFSSRDRKKLYFEISRILARRPLTGGYYAQGAVGHRYMKIDDIVSKPQLRRLIKRSKNKERILREAIDKLVEREELNLDNDSVSINGKAIGKLLYYYRIYSGEDKELAEEYNSFKKGLEEIGYSVDEKVDKFKGELAEKREKSRERTKKEKQAVK